MARSVRARHRASEPLPPGAAGLVAAARAVGVRDPAVLAAIAATPRDAYVPSAYAGQAYLDEPVPIPHGQVTSQPSLQAAMVAALGLNGSQNVLEIGTGYGYQTALLARLARHVVSIEVFDGLAERARRNLSAHGVANATVLTGDGTQGVPERAPFDAIIVCAAYPEVPCPLIGQLRVGGRLVQPIGPGGSEDVVAYRRTAAGLTRERVITGARFVRLHGQHGYPRASA